MHVYVYTHVHVYMVNIEAREMRGLYQFLKLTLWLLDFTLLLAISFLFSETSDWLAPSKCVDSYKEYFDRPMEVELINREVYIPYFI